MVEAQHIHPLDGVVFRITDRQGYQATERWTLNLAEQARLEALINRVKPPLPVDWPEAETGQPLPVHSLLLTPFRYPPHPLRTGRDSVHPIPGNSSMPLGRWRKCCRESVSRPAVAGRLTFASFGQSQVVSLAREPQA